MYDFFTNFVMHDICMWILGYDLSLTWKINWIDSGLPKLFISWISMVFVGLFP